MSRIIKWFTLFSLFSIHLYTFTEENNPAIEEVVEKAAISKFNQLLGSKSPYIELKYFTPDSSDGSTSGYGLAYDWERKANTSFKISEDLSKYSSTTFSAYAKGNYVFADKNNPEDLSKAGISYEFINADYAPILKGEVLTESTGNSYQKECLEGFETKSEWCESTNKILNKLTIGDASTIWSLKLKANIQGNQDYSEKEYVYGLGAGIRYTPAIDSPYRLLNIFELPFRYITQPLMDYATPGYSDRSFPVVHVGLDVIEPSDNKVRNDILSSKDNYERAYAEVGYITTIGKYKNQSMKFSYHYRYFLEFDAEKPIEEAKLDRFHYAVYAIQIPGAAFNLDIPQVITLSYSTGKLPFNLSNDAIFQLGFKSSVELGKLFGLD